jgi:hypothetical protein
MVTMRKTPISTLATVALSAILISACSVSQFWGEEPPAPEFAIAPAGKECPSPGKIFTDSETASTEAFSCWEGQLQSIWTDVRGKTRNRLTEREVSTLIEKQILRLEGSIDENTQRLLSAKRLLGINGDLTRESLNEWLDWLKQNRSKIRSIYSKLSAYSKSNGYLSYPDLRNVSEMAASFLRKAGWNMPSANVAQLAAHFVRPESIFLRDSMTELSRVLINLAEAGCPTLAGTDTWETSKLAECAEAFSAHVEPGAAWIEYAFNPYHEHRMGDVERSLEFLAPKLKSWFADERLKPVQTRLWIKFAQQLGVRAEERSLENLDWIKTFNQKSDRYAIHPSALTLAVEILVDWQKSVFQGLQWFNTCDFRKAEAWKNCTVKLTPEIEERSPVLKTASRIRNPHYSDRVLPFNRLNFSALMLFDAMAKKIFSTYDSDANGIITIRSLGEKDELLDMLGSAFKVQKNTEFIDDITDRIKGIGPQRIRGESIIRSFEPQGIAKLITLMGNVLYRQDKKDIFFFDSVLANIGSLFPKNATHLSQASITGVLSTIDSLGAYRRGYLDMDSVLEHPIVAASTQTGEKIVSRGAFIKAMPVILKEFFPRLYQSCDDFGFERSCGTVFSNLIPGLTDEDMMHATDLDVVTISAIFIENMLDRCDSNGDEKLSEAILDGSDELDCGFTHLKDMVERLMDARIIPNDPVTRGALGFINSFFLTRPLGKVSLARGTSKGVALRYIPSLIIRDKATMGSIMGLAAEVIDPDHVEYLEKNGLGKKKKQKKKKKKNERSDSSGAEALSEDEAARE